MQLGITFVALIFENLVLISHTIPMSIYVAIEVLKWLQVRSVYSDQDLMMDPGDIGVSLASMHSEHRLEKLKEM